jgi:hypothetical protein
MKNEKCKCVVFSVFKRYYPHNLQPPPVLSLLLMSLVVNEGRGRKRFDHDVCSRKRLYILRYWYILQKNKGM